jgi:uncharacterized protein with HEPN domain
VTRNVDDRMRLSESQGDVAGVQIAFDSFLHNPFVIGEAVKSLPPTLLDSDPETPWNEIAAMRYVIGHRYHRVVPAIIHRTVQGDLGPLEAAVNRLLAFR